MNKILEISGDDIALLGDDDLRELIGLLCEADCRVYIPVECRPLNSAQVGQSFRPK